MIPCSIELSNMYFCLIQEMTPRSIDYLLLQTNKIIIIMKLEANSALFQYVRNKRGSKRLNWNCHLHSYVQGLNHLSKLTRLKTRKQEQEKGRERKEGWKKSLLGFRSRKHIVHPGEISLTRDSKKPEVPPPKLMM